MSMPCASPDSAGNAIFDLFRLDGDKVLEHLGRGAADPQSGDCAEQDGMF